MRTLDLFRHDFVVSIRPAYALKIVEGLKTVELRRRFPDETVTGALMYIYATAPIQAVVGYATIVCVERQRVSDIWERYRDVAYIDRADFDAYFEGTVDGFVLVLADPVSLPKPVGVDRLKAELSFTPPQSFAYADESFRRLIEQ